MPGPIEFSFSLPVLVFAALVFATVLFPTVFFDQPRADLLALDVTRCLGAFGAAFSLGGSAST